MNKIKRIGGQAVINGVMLRSEDRYVVGVLRRSDNKIIFYEKQINKNKTVRKIKSIPLVRGIFTLIDSLVIGISALNFSSLIFEEDEDEKIIKNKKKSKKKKQKKIEPTVISFVLSLIFSLIIALFIFKYIPILFTSFLTKKIKLTSFTFSLVEGMMRILIFVSYLLFIRLFKDIRLTFAYHGAEHTVVNAYEKLKKIPKLEQLKKFSTRHRRCGTTYIIVVLIIAILLFGLISLEYSILTKFLIRLALLPLIAALSYEILMIYEKLEQKKTLVRTIFSLPFLPFISLGMFIQSLTTAKVNQQQLKVALEVLKRLIR